MTATGFDFEPLPNGDVLMEFLGDGEITEDLSLVRDRHTNPGFDQMLREAPLFEVANDEEVEQ